MGINVRVQKSPKATDIIVAEVKLERDLKSCMRCRFFYGNTRQCIAKKCVKEDMEVEKAIKEEESKCLGCPYLNTEGYCFPCMKEILGIIKKKQIVNEQEKKKDG